MASVTYAYQYQVTDPSLGGLTLVTTPGTSGNYQVTDAGSTVPLIDGATYTIGGGVGNSAYTGYTYGAGIIVEDLAPGSGVPQGTFWLYTNDPAVAASISASNTGDIADAITFCFVEGTLIATPAGEVAVETLKIGDHVLTAAGAAVPVRWIGVQKVDMRGLAFGRRMPVRIRAGALGDGLPHSDLLVSPDHGMVIDGLVVVASALVNGDSIDWMPATELPEVFTYYHIETEAHDVVLANGAPAETFVDASGRSRFDNHAEYLALYGAERLIPEMAAPRVIARRQLPQSLRARLGIPSDLIDDTAVAALVAQVAAA